jgi:RNA polymerase primary sigma factor
MDTKGKAKMRSDSSDTVSWYFSEIQKYPQLSHATSTSLFQALQAGSTSARRTLINSNLRLVISIAKQYRKSEVPMEDLIQEGNIGLMKAIERFDWKKGFRFSTYATWWIKQSIGQLILKRRKTIRLPAHAAGLQKRMIEAAEEYRKEMGTEPTDEEIAELTGASARIVKATRLSGRQVLSLDQPSGSSEDGEFTLGHTIADTSDSSNPLLCLERAEYATVIRNMFAALANKETQVLRLRFGISEDPTNSEDFPITEDELAAVVLHGKGLE